MSIPDLIGKTGNGIRKVAQGRRTDTEAWIEIWLGNVADDFISGILNTTIVDGHLELVNKTAAEITITCFDAPVESERVQVYKATAGAGETKIGEPVNITDDPLVKDDGVDYYNDSNEWQGLGIRKVKFTNLEDRWYKAIVETNLVATHGGANCKVTEIKFRPKNNKSVKIVNVGCFDDSGEMFFGDEGFDDGNYGGAPLEFARSLIKDGIDYLVSADDFNYGKNLVNDRFWSLPLTSNTSVRAKDETLHGAGPDSIPRDVPMHKEIYNNVIPINVGDVVTTRNATGRQAYTWIHECLTNLMNPAVIMLGYECVIAITDIGDHGIRRSNGTAFGAFAGKFNLNLWQHVDLGFVTGASLLTKPSDDNTTCWVHGGLAANADSGSNPYDQAATNPTLHQNIILEMALCERIRVHFTDLQDFFYGNKFEFNHVSASPTTMQIPPYISSMSEITDVTNTAASGTGLDVPDEYYYYPRWRYMDFGNHTRVYAIDQSFFSFGLGQNVLAEDDPGNSLFYAYAHPAVRSAGSVMTENQISELSTHMNAGQNSFKQYVVLAGDVLYGEVDFNNNPNEDVTQTDTMNKGQPVEFAAYKTLIESLDIDIILMTSDHHINGLTSFNPHVIEAHASIGPQGGPRDFGLDPSVHKYEWGTYSEGASVQAASNRSGWNRFNGDSNGCSVVTKSASVDPNYNYTNLFMSSRFENYEGVLRFEDPKTREAKKPKGVKIDQQNFSMIKVN